MYVRVDNGVEADKIEGFTFLNQDGDEEGVVLDGSTVDIGPLDSYSDKFTLYVKDIPKLIKALQQADLHIKTL